MKLIVYRCANEACEFETEELFNSDETIPSILTKRCPICQDQLIKFNFKNNQQNWRYADEPRNR